MGVDMFWPLFGCCIINFLILMYHISTLFLCFYLFQLSFFLACLISVNLVGYHEPLTKKKEKKE